MRSFGLGSSPSAPETSRVVERGGVNQNSTTHAVLIATSAADVETENAHKIGN